jgi:hypothetical protein
MVFAHGLIGIALAAAQLAPQASPSAAPQPSAITTVVPVDGFSLGAKPASTLTKDQAEALRSQCGDRRFETSAEGLIDGEMKRRKITLCAAPGDSDAQWITKLENAIVWIKGQPGLSDPVKAKLVADLEAKIGEVRFVAPMRALPSRGLPAADALVSNVPPMPPPLPVSTLSGAAMLALAPPVVARPPLTLRCLAAGERGDGTRCGRLASNTVFAVHADGNLSGPVTLRFMRRGEFRAESSVAALRQGQVVRLKMPAQVCAGVVRADVAIEVMSGQPTPGRISQIADKFGPFDLHC